MNILFVDSQYPMFDRASADVRMFAIVRLLREQGHNCHYYVTDIIASESRTGASNVARYRSALAQIGVETIERIGFENVLSTYRYDLVFFKYFYPAEQRIALVRIWQPDARILVDSVDLVYVRMFAKAKLSRVPADRVEAEEIKRRELATYSAADLVVTVTEDELSILARELPSMPAHVVPNIHELHTSRHSESQNPSLLFIGAFTHEPNVDGVLWFAHEIWPKVRVAHPNCCLRIIGGSAPAEIHELHGEGIEVLGYVPDTLPYLSSSWVSVAPLRFGAGMKGKVGEAMAAGLPVVTTAFGAEGFGITPGIHLLVADGADEFAECVSSLLSDREHRIRLGSAGRAFIESRYSPLAVKRVLAALADRASNIPPRPVAKRGGRYLARRLSLWMQRNLLWRFQRKVEG